MFSYLLSFLLGDKPESSPFSSDCHLPLAFPPSQPPLQHLFSSSQLEALPSLHKKEKKKEAKSHQTQVGAPQFSAAISRNHLPFCPTRGAVFSSYAKPMLPSVICTPSPTPSGSYAQRFLAVLIPRSLSLLHPPLLLSWPLPLTCACALFFPIPLFQSDLFCS